MNLKLAGGIAIAFGLSILSHFLQWEHNSSLSARLDAANTQLTTAQNNEKARGESADAWKDQAEKCAGKNADLTTRNANLEQANAMAAAKAGQVAGKAAAELAAWKARYAMAMKNGTCADILTTPLTVCPELVK